MTVLYAYSGRYVVLGGRMVTLFRVSVLCSRLTQDLCTFRITGVD